MATKKQQIKTFVKPITKKSFLKTIKDASSVGNKDKLFVKNNIIKVLDDLDLFTSSYSDNRNKYLEVKDNGQIDQIGYYRSFVFKTIENDKTPLSEIKKYIVELKKANNKI